MDFSGCEMQDDGMCCVMREEEVTTLQKDPILGRELLLCARSYFCTAVCRKASVTEISNFHYYFNQSEK